MNKSVLFVTPYFKPRLGGLETHVYEVSKELIKKGWKIDLLTEHIKGTESITIPGLTLLPISVKNSLQKSEVWQQVSQYKNRFTGYDVIHVHDVAWWLLPWLFVIRKKLFITFHGWEGTYPIRWQAKLQRWLFSLCAQGTLHVGHFIQKFYWDKPTIVTYGGVRISSQPAFLRQPTKHFHFTFFGRLEKENAVEEYLELFTLLQKTGKKITVTWVGDGAYRAECEKIGRVTGMLNEPSNYLKEADFVCANSYLSMLEAQAEGKVVCAVYQHLLKKEYLEKYPGSKAIVLGGNAVQMFEKITTLMDDKQKFKELSESAYQYAKSQTWDKVATQYEKLWANKL